MSQYEARPHPYMIVPENEDEACHGIPTLLTEGAILIMLASLDGEVQWEESKALRRKLRGLLSERSPAP